jgi:hypothetical protein
MVASFIGWSGVLCVYSIVSTKNQEDVAISMENTLVGIMTLSQVSTELWEFYLSPVWTDGSVQFIAIVVKQSLSLAMSKDGSTLAVMFVPVLEIQPILTSMAGRYLGEIWDRHDSSS